jgi:hypothetical protein
MPWELLHFLRGDIAERTEAEPPSEILQFVEQARLRFLDGEPGMLILDGMKQLPSGAWTRAFLSLCSILGRPLAQDASGGLVREVRNLGKSLTDRGVRYSETRQGGSFHTDGAPSPDEIPDYFALLCIHQAPVGGALVVIDARTVLAELHGRSPQSVSILSRHFHFDQRRADRPTATVRRPILSTDHAGAAQVIYLRDYIESAHAMPHVPDLAPAELNALDELDAILNDGRLQVEGRLSPGQVAIVNNRRVVHGRREFTDTRGNSAKRLLLRLWLERRVGSSVGFS